MRLVTIIFLGWLFATGAAPAEPKAPNIKTETPYPIARQQLLSQGFDPVPIVDRGQHNPTCDYADPDPMCRTYPELLNCSGTGLGYCEFLFRRRADGKFWIIVTKGDAGLPPDVDFRRVTFDNDGPAQKSDLEGLVVRKADGRRMRLTTVHKQR